jgi:hypothetical protein
VLNRKRFLGSGVDNSQQQKLLLCDFGSGFYTGEAVDRPAHSYWRISFGTNLNIFGIVKEIIEYLDEAGSKSGVKSSSRLD